MDIDADIFKAARGDHVAFGRVVEAHQDRLFAYLGRMGIDRVNAEDIAQDTFLRVWRHASRFNPNLGSLTTWILTIARNLALTHLTRPARIVEMWALPTAHEAVADERSPTGTARAAAPKTLHVALNQLSLADRSLLAASYVDGLAPAEIARLECGAVTVRLHRARVRLRQILENDDA